MTSRDCNTKIDQSFLRDTFCAGCISKAATMSITVTAIHSDDQWHALRRQVVGASEAGALVGEHEYLTYWGLWAKKSGKLADTPDNSAMERGRRLEPVAVQMIRDRNPSWDVTAERVHYSDHEFGIGATPDCIVDDPERGRGVIQIKSVAPQVFRQSWRGDSDAVKPPVWIAIQALVEAELTGAKWAAVAPLVVDYGIDLPLIEVPLHAGIIDTIKSEALAFWRQVHEGREPEPDYRRDAALIRAALGADDGSEIDLSQDTEVMLLLSARDSLMDRMKQDEKDKSEIDGRLVHRMGNAARARFNGGYISLKTVNKAAYQVKATSYRQLRVVRDHGERHSDHDGGGKNHGRV
jgi:predicted phage-related endonuclease